MLKSCLLLISLLLVAMSANADVAKYYKGTESLKGYALKTALSKILANNHIDRGYSSLIDVFFRSDVDNYYDNDGTILDIYSEVPGDKDPYVFRNRAQKCGNYSGESDCFNREHIFPQSIFNYKYPMKSDFHHVFPTDGHVNAKRWHYPFGEVATEFWSSQNGSKLGISKYGSYNEIVFEPIDEFKGEVARALLYFATRYEDQVMEWDSDMLNGTKDQVYTDRFIKVLIKWHKQDPVSAHEVHRNKVGFGYQGNRNPFIDHPEWVELIWEN